MGGGRQCCGLLYDNVEIICLNVVDDLCWCCGVGVGGSC